MRKKMTNVRSTLHEAIHVLIGAAACTYSDLGIHCIKFDYMASATSGCFIQSDCMVVYFSGTLQC